MILSVEKLSHSYGVRTLFKDVTFNIEMGDKIGIIGVNGTGKSTLCPYYGTSDNQRFCGSIQLQAERHHCSPL